MQVRQGPFAGGLHIGLVQMCAAALVASINPSIVARQNTGTDSEGVRLSQLFSF